MFPEIMFYFRMNLVFDLLESVEKVPQFLRVGYATGNWNLGNQKGWFLSDNLTKLLRENAFTFEWKWQFSKATTNQFLLSD